MALVCLALSSACAQGKLFGPKPPARAEAPATRPAQRVSPELLLRRDFEQLKNKVIQLEQETMIIGKINASLMDENSKLRVDKSVLKSELKRSVGTPPPKPKPAPKPAPKPKPASRPVLNITANVATVGPLIRPVEQPAKPIDKPAPKPVIEEIKIIPVPPLVKAKPALPTTPLILLEKDDLNLDALIKKLAVKAPDIPAAARLLEKIQMIKRLEDSGVPLESLTGTDPVAGKLLPQMIDVFKAFKQQDYDTSYEIAAKVLKKLEKSASFAISRVELCPAINNAITNYGNYIPVKERKFSRNTQLYVYCEISRFGQIKKENGKFAISTKIELAVLDNDGNRLWNIPIKPVDFISKHKVTDLYYPIPFVVPSNLTAGEYLLEITVEDLAKKMTDVERLRFTVN